MDMMETLRYTVLPEDVGESSFMPPSALAQKLALAGTLRNRAEGGGRERLEAVFKATWMFRRIRFSQFAPVQCGDELVGFGSSRTALENEYAFRGELYRAGLLVAQMDMIMMPVVLGDRRRLRCEDIEPLYSSPPKNDVPLFPRLPTVSDLSYDHKKLISAEDCDVHASHFAFHNYIGLICRELDYAALGCPLISELQVDYVKECVPGKTILIGVRPDASCTVIQGKHLSGRPCFNARCQFQKESAL